MEKTPTVARHGPQITDDDLKTWLATGMAPDGHKVPTREALRFVSFEELLRTREVALRSYESRLVTTLTRPHPAGYTRAEVVLPYRSPIGSGWRGRDGSEDPERPGC